MSSVDSFTLFFRICNPKALNKRTARLFLEKRMIFESKILEKRMILW